MTLLRMGRRSGTATQRIIEKRIVYTRVSPGVLCVICCIRVYTYCRGHFSHEHVRVRIDREVCIRLRGDGCQAMSKINYGCIVYRFHVLYFIL